MAKKRYLNTKQWAYKFRNESDDRLRKIISSRIAGQKYAHKRCGAQLVLAKRIVDTDATDDSGWSVTPSTVCLLKNENLSEATILKAIHLLANLNEQQLRRISRDSKSSAIREIATQNCSLRTKCNEPAVKLCIKPVKKPRRGKTSTRPKAYTFVKHRRVRFLRGGMHP